MSLNSSSYNPEGGLNSNMTNSVTNQLFNDKRYGYVKKTHTAPHTPDVHEKQKIHELFMYHEIEDLWKSKVFIEEKKEPVII
jgi:hypothetical protein